MSFLSFDGTRRKHGGTPYSIFLTLRRSLRRGLSRRLPSKYLSFRLHKSWYQEETSRGPQHKALRALRCSWFRSVSTLSELLIRVPANSKLDLIFSETLSQVFVRSRTTSTLTCVSRLTPHLILGIVLVLVKHGGFEVKIILH